MFSNSKIKSYLVALAISLTFIGCGGDQVETGTQLLTCSAPKVVSSDGNSCVDPEPIQCPAPLVPNEFNDGCEVGADPNAPLPSVFPTENQAILYYNRANRGATNEANDPSYDGYVLHTWNNEECDAYAEPFNASVWGSEHVYNGIDPNYGAYWILELKDGHDDCANFIIHIGTDDAGKEMGGGDKQMNLVQDDPDFVRMNWTISGYPDPLEYPITDLGPQPLNIEGYAAHWIDTSTLVWDLEDFEVEQLAQVRLHHSATAGIEADENDNLNGIAVDLTAGVQSDSVQATSPATASWEAFINELEVADVKSILKTKL